MWDAATGELLLTIPDDAWPPPLWSADGTRIIIHSRDGVWRIWDVLASSPTYGEELSTFAGQSGGVQWMSWSPTRNRIVTASNDGTWRVWDLSTGAELVRYSPGGVLCTADWSPDGTRIVVSSWDGTAKVFPAWQTTQELIDYAKEYYVVRELTDTEREQFGLGPR
jgi:WD40 repeat protein